MEEQTERELKFDVPSGWVLPDPTPLTPDGGSVLDGTIHLRSAYYDTEDRDLLRSALTLRRRTGDADAGWHLKLPAVDGRTEVRLPVDGESVPGEFVDLLRGITAGGELRIIATIETERGVHRVIGPSGAAIAEIADDHVTAVAAGEAAVITRWREVEVELLADGDGRFLRRSAKWLARSGAEPSRSASKLARAVEATDTHAPEGSLSALVQDYLRAQHRAIVRGDIELRRGGDVVHPTRVACRRFRSVLRVFADLFDPVRAQALDAELKWYAQVLGDVRDVQVMRRHLVEELGDIPDESGLARAHLERELAAAEAVRLQALRMVLDQNRYAMLLREVRAFTEQSPGDPTRPTGDVKRYLRSTRRTTRKRLRKAASPGSLVELVHRARKSGKRTRYTAELAEPELGAKAHRLVERMKAMQDDLGALQDAVVAADFVRASVVGAPPEAAFALGVLWCREVGHSASAHAVAERLDADLKL